MDKCKYYLTDKGVTLTFNSDAELTEFIRNNYYEQGTVKPGVSDLFESNSELANAVYEALGVDNIITPNDKIVWGHPAIGKTTMLESNPDAFMDWDNEFNRKRDSWIANKSNTVIGTPEFKKARNEYMINYNNHKDYIAFVTEEWNKAKEKAKKENKTLIASPHMLLNLFPSDFDKVITMNDKTFMDRAIRRSEGDEVNSKLWKEGINETLKSVDKSKIIETDKYINDLFVTPEQKQQAQQLYSQYLDTIFPDSKIKDIVYHGTDKKFDRFDDNLKGSRDSGLYGKAHYFSSDLTYAKETYAEQWEEDVKDKNKVIKTNNGFVYRAILNAKNVFIENSLIHDFNKDVYHILDKSNYDSATDNRGQIEIAVKNANQIHILGSKQDIEGFKEFVKKPRIKYSKVDSGQLTKAEQVLQHINKSNPAINYDSSMFFSAYDFLREKHDISGNGIEEYLSPDLNEDNYIEKESLRLIKEDPTFKAKAEIDKEQAITEAKAFLKAELKVDKRMEDVSIAASKVIRNIIADGNGIITLKTIEPFLKAIAKYNQEEYTEGLFKKDQQDNLINIFKKWYEQNIQDSGYLYKAGVMLNKQQQIKSKSGASSFLTYMAINKYGIPDLVNVKVSRDYFSNWHSAKKLNAFYHLGVSRQILNGLLPDDISTDTSLLQVLPIITPLDSNGKINIESIIIAEPQIQQNSDLALKIQQNLQRLLPNPIKENTAESMALIEKNSQTLNAMLGKYQFRTKLLKTSAEKKAQEVIDRAKENKSSTLKLYDTILKTSIEEPNTTQGQENFKKRVADYYERYNANQHSATLDIIKQINAKQYESEEFKRIFERYNNPN